MADDERNQSPEAERASEAEWQVAIRRDGLMDSSHNDADGEPSAEGGDGDVGGRGQCDEEHTESGESAESDEDGVGGEGTEDHGKESELGQKDALGSPMDSDDWDGGAISRCGTAHGDCATSISFEHREEPAIRHAPSHETGSRLRGVIVCLLAALMTGLAVRHLSCGGASQTMTGQNPADTEGSSESRRNDEIEERLWMKWVARDQSGDRMTEAQRSVVDAAIDTETAGEGMCLAWVNDVFESAGWEFERLWAASEAYQIWCHSTDRHDLKPGMIVAVESTDTSPVAGHIAIYIGNGMVRDNETWGGKGVVKTRSLDEWVEMFGKVSTPKWGWAGGYDLSDPMTHPKRTRSQASATASK